MADVVVTVHDRHVVIDDDDGRMVQVLGSPAEALAHHDRVVALRRKKGYAVVEDAGAAEFRPPDALELAGFVGTFEVDAGRCTITLGGDDDEAPSRAVCLALVERISRAQARRVDLVCEESSPGRNWEKALAGVTLASVEAFVLDVPTQTQTRQREISIGDLAAVLGACPGLTRMFCTGDLKLRPTEHAALRELHLAGDPLALRVAAALAGCRLPALERLVLSFAADTGPLDDDAMLGAVLALHAPRLREVHLADIDDVPGFLAELAARGLPSSWRVLSLAGTWDNAHDGDDVRPVLEGAGAAFRGLEALVMAIDEGETSELGALAPVRARGAERDLFLPTAYQGW